MLRLARHLAAARRPGARRPARRRPRSDRGAALLLAVMSVAIVTALAVDLTYQTQVRLRTAANARDELRAAALARSAVHVSRLVLSFQQQMDQMSKAMCQGAAAAGGGAGGLPTQGCLRLQVWNLVPVSSALTQALFAEGGGKERRPEAARGDAAGGVQPVSLADFQGGYEAKIEDEAEKINAQLDGGIAGGRLTMQVQALLQMMCDAKWDPLFDREQVDGERYSRADLVTNLRDWVDEDSTSSSLNATVAGGNCAISVAANPFEKAFADENLRYDRASGDDRYRAKNARFDSLEELHLVAGISDAWLAAFQDRLTVYLPREAAMNVNTKDPRRQLLTAALMADPASVATLLDPAVQTLFFKALSAATMNGTLSITPVQFAQIEEAAGVKVRHEFTVASQQSPFTDTSMVYRIRAFGVAGDVTHEVDAVVTFDPNQKPIEQRTPANAAASGTPDFGTLIRWRED